jgi:hypothetical protein
MKNTINKKNKMSTNSISQVAESQNCEVESHDQSLNFDSSILYVWVFNDLSLCLFKKQKNKISKVFFLIHVIYATVIFWIN